MRAEPDIKTRPKKLTLILAARFNILTENLAASYWPLGLLVAVFMVLAMAGAFSLIGDRAHALTVILVGALALFLLWRGRQALVWPDYEQARRRIEQDNGMPHRPLETLDDRLANGLEGPEQVILWREHLRRMQRKLPKLGYHLPRPVLAASDPRALGWLAILGLVVTAIMAGHEAPSRIASALTPNFAVIAGDFAEGPRVDLWITPPEYTGEAPLFLSSSDAAALPRHKNGLIAAPLGSRLKARVQGRLWTPYLDLAGRRQSFTQVERGLWETEMTLQQSGQLALYWAFQRLGRWRIVGVADQPPTITFAEPPEGTERKALKLSYQAEDDFGLSSVQAVITLNTIAEAAVRQSPIIIDLPLAGARPKTAENASYHDLTASPWAGLPVQIRLVAQDAAENTGDTEPRELTLPEREFTHPVAIDVIEQRRRLTLRPQALNLIIAGELRRIFSSPGRYDNDVVVFLALNSAVTRLTQPGYAQEIDNVIRMLWDVALRIEDGGVSDAEQELRQAQQQLMQALQDEDISREELLRLIDEVERHAAELMQALAERLQNLAETQVPQSQIGLETLARLYEATELQDMLKEMRELTELGARDAAREMLSRLQRMMENLDTASLQPGSAQMQEMAQTLEELQDITQAQQQLLEQTFELDKHSPPNHPAQVPGEFPQSQENLRMRLGELMTELGSLLPELPPGLGAAERAMNEAGKALLDGDLQSAMAQQNLALESLQNGGQQAMRQFMGQGQMLSIMGINPGGSRLGRDPFGNAMPWQRSQSDVNIPKESERRRVRDILEELRRRSGEINRPREERDYIERLLRRF